MWWALAAALTALWWGRASTRRVLHPPRRPLDPPDPLPSYVTHTLRAPDGASFDVWRLTPPASPRRRVLLFHGYYTNRYQVLELADDLRHAGVDVLLLELRGHGSRPGPYTFGLREVDDAQAALTWAAAADGAPVPVGVIGLSTGAAVACQVAARLPDVRAVVTDSVYPRFYPIVRRSIRHRYHLPAFPCAWITWLALCLALRVRLSMLDPVRLAAHLRLPLLAIHGGQDEVVPAEEGAQFFRAWAGPKSHWLEPTGTHVRIYGARRADYVARVAAFLEETLHP